MDDFVNKITCGNALEVLKQMPDEFVDCVMTSPPYWALRDYGVADQLGLERTYQEYITKLCNIFDEVKRVLKKTGTCWVNMGDTYSAQRWTGNGKGQPMNKFNDGHRDINPEKITGMEDKCLVQIPSRFAIEMCNRGWILRNEIIWHKPNCMPSSVKDRFTVDFEKVFFFVKNRKYWFETQYEPQGEVREHRTNHRDWNNTKFNKRGASPGTIMRVNPNGRNKRCVWTITAKHFKEAHFATYPPELCATPIKAGCPEFVCKKCGESRKKIIENGELILGSHHRKAVGKYENEDVGGKMFYREKNALIPNAHYEKIDKGYTDCGCNAGFESGIVLDPFMGSGTTAVVARSLGRKFTGIELNPKYVEMANKRARNIIRGGQP